jgi:hypothetical protein
MSRECGNHPGFSKAEGKKQVIVNSYSLSLEGLDVDYFLFALIRKEYRKQRSEGRQQKMIPLYYKLLCHTPSANQFA